MSHSNPEASSTEEKSSLAIFDLDNTLIAGDSDHAWGEFLIARGLVDEDDYRRQNDAFYDNYKSGSLDIDAYLHFALNFLSGKTPEELTELHDDFMRTMISPMLLDQSRDLLAKHRDAGSYLLIITATNSFITTPIAHALGVDNIFASDAEIIDGQYTGKPCGTPCFHEGKVTRLMSWLDTTEFNLEDTWFYSDSINDLPLLETVGKPVAVDPDPALLAHANAKSWPVISLRDN